MERNQETLGGRIWEIYLRMEQSSSRKMMAHLQQNPPFLLDSLYCQEGHFDDETEESYFEDETEDCNIIRFSPKHEIILLDQDLSWEEEELFSLFSKEEQNGLRCNLENKSFLAESRREAVEWVLKVVAHYSFSALTAVLAVNYLDRFLFSFQFQRDKPWMTQLAAVSCLSLAAKVEETQVPLLLDLQVEKTKYVFEAKTIQRMEILVLSTLKWKMNPVTPLSFLDYITRRLGLKDRLCWEFLKRSESLLLSFIADCRFMCYLPSVIATATMLLVVNSLEPCVGLQYKTQLLGILEIDKGKVKDCCKLIQDLTSREFSCTNKRKFGSFPDSPKGVMDLSFSSDSSNDSWSMTASPEPISKKSKAQDQQMQSLDNATADILSIPL